MTILVTGGAGFIGTNFALEWLNKAGELIANLDKLTYAGNLVNLDASKDMHRTHSFCLRKINKFAYCRMRMFSIKFQLFTKIVSLSYNLMQNRNLVVCVDV